MQLYTHILIGGAIGAALVPGNSSAIFLTSLGSVASDIPIALQAAVDILQKKPPLSREKENGFWFTFKEISHSPLWFLGFLATPPSSLTFWILLGWSSHWVVDVLTHGSAKFSKTDQSLAWPFYQLGLSPKLGVALGIWDYRERLGTMKAKPFELVFDVALIFFILFRSVL